MPDDERPTVPELPEDLSALNDAELAALHAELEAAYTQLRAEATTVEHVEQLRGIRSAQSAVADVVNERVEVSRGLAETDTAVPLPEMPIPPEPEAEATPEEPEVADTPEEPAAEVEEGEKVPAMASVTADDLAGQREAQAPPPEQTPSRPRIASLTAPAGSRIVEPGTELGFEEIGAMMTDLIRGQSFDGKTRVAGLPGFQSSPELADMVLSKGNSTQANDESIRLASQAWREQYNSRQTRTASPAQVDQHRTWDTPAQGAICDPLDIIREIPDCVQASEPFSDALPSRPAGRLGFTFTPSMSLADVAAGVTVWDETDQAAVTSTDSTWKPCVDVDCPTPQDVTAEAVTACLQFDNTTDMSNPERVRDAMSKVAAMRARVKTARLLHIADNLSHHYDFTAPYGSLPGFVQAVLSILPQGEYPERLDDGEPYVAFVPPGLLESLVIDRDNVGYLSDVTRGQLTSFIEGECASAGWNVRIVDLEDVSETEPAPFAALNSVGAANRAALPGLGGYFRVRLIAPAGALYFSTGDINYGIERSPELNRQNRAQFFAEEYVGLAKHGCQPWYTLHVDLCESGARAGLVTPFVCADTAGRS